MTPRHDTVESAPADLVRPYALTGGRTAARSPMLLETLVIATEGGRPDGFLLPELRQILLLCRQPRAVAEIAAALKLPVRVAHVLVGDLADQGAITLAAPPLDRTERPVAATLSRVLDALLLEGPEDRA